jgi:hypothetical protein
MSAVEILAEALVADEGAGEAVDVSEHAILRLDWLALADIGRDPQVTLWIETAPTSAGPWSEVSRIQMAAFGWNTKPRVVLGTFDNFIRARWSGRIARVSKETAAGGTHVDFFTLGLAGDGKPDAGGE